MGRFWQKINGAGDAAAWWERYTAPDFGVPVPCQPTYKGYKVMGIDPWFPEDEYVDGSLEVRAAKDVCESCPMARACLDYAQEAGVPYGIWGGTTPHERRELRRKVKRERAR